MTPSPAKALVTLAVVMACHNRRDTTLRCLDSLFAQQSETLHIRVYLLDDASNDGTAEAIEHAFPQVTLLAGDGRRFWGGGMYDAMRSAGTTGYDFMLWLNDDVDLHDGALPRLLAAHDDARVPDETACHIIVGACIDPEIGTVRYGGRRRRSRWHPARLDLVPPDPARLIRCDTMNGNCVLVPIEAVRRIGLIDPAYVQQLGDIDYGYRATRAGAMLWVARQPAGDCTFGAGSAGDRLLRPWLDPALGLPARWRLINTPLGYPLRPWLRFMWRYGGVPGILAIAYTYVRVLFPVRTA